MNVDDIVYVALLLFSIGFGNVYRKIEDKSLKKNVGSALGLTIILIVSGWHTLHVLITIFINSVIILYTNQKSCHLKSFIFSFTYLIFFRTSAFFGIPYAPGHTNLIQMLLVLKLVGLALDVQQTKRLEEDNQKNWTDDELLEVKSLNCDNLNMIEIFYYATHYCGILTGPYFRYRTYYDHLHLQLYKYDRTYLDVALRKLAYVPMFAILYLTVNYCWPLTDLSRPDFERFNFFHRYWYIWPTFFTFRMRMYIGMTLSECVCIMAGVGCYPDFTQPKPCEGPTKQLVDIINSKYDPERLKQTSYNYDTVHNIDPYNADFCLTIREGMKHWNISVQYWLAVNVYKRFPAKNLRTHCTMLVSAVWHGIYSGYYICILSVPFALIAENVWIRILMKEKLIVLPENVLKFVMVFLKMQLYSYIAMAFSLLQVNQIIKYYNSVYHCLLIFYVCIYLFGKLWLKTVRKVNK